MKIGGDERFGGDPSNGDIPKAGGPRRRRKPAGAVPLSFEDGGRRVKASDAICWRSLEGRSCFSAAAQSLARSTPLVVVAIAPAKRRQAAQQAGSAGAEAAPSGCAACADGAAKLAENWDSRNRGVKAAAERVQEIAVAAGLRAALDAGFRRRPGEMFHHWEAQGVLFRLEVGAREAESGTVCLWAHPARSAVLQGVADLLGMPPPASVKGQRLHGIPMAALPEACCCLLTAADCEGLFCNCPPAPSVTHNADADAGISPRGGSAAVQKRSRASPICSKLHLELLGDPGEAPVCVDHLRWLVGTGRPCHCTSERHLGMGELQEAVAAAAGRANRRAPAAWSGGGGGDADDPELEPAAVVVGAIPDSCCPATLMQELDDAFKPFGLQHVHAGKVKGRFRHGWARVYVRSLAEARRAVEAMADGKLVHQGAPLLVSMSAGRTDTLFPMLPHRIRCKLRIDSVGAFSVTDQVIADKITRIVAGMAEAVLLQGGPAEGCAPGLLPLTITDATACSGGNTLSFMSKFSHIHSVELDADRVEDLRHNVDTVLRGGSAGATGEVTTHHGDYLKLMLLLRQDVVWLDPPWGGPEYNQGRKLQDLYLGETPVSALCAQLLSAHASMVALRLPSTLATAPFLRLVLAGPAGLGSTADQAVSQAAAEKGTISHLTVHDSAVQMGRSTLLILVRGPPASPESADHEKNASENIARVLREICSSEGGLVCRSGKWQQLGGAA